MKVNITVKLGLKTIVEIKGIVDVDNRNKALSEAITMEGWLERMTGLRYHTTTEGDPTALWTGRGESH